MKKIYAILTLISSLFASDELLERMKKNEDQELILKLAQMPRTSEVREAVGYYLELLEAASTHAVKTDSPASQEEDFTMEIMGGKNIKTLWEQLLNGTEQEANDAYIQIIRLGEYPNTKPADFAKAKKAFSAAEKKLGLSKSISGGQVLGHVRDGTPERFVEFLKNKFDIDARVLTRQMFEGQEIRIALQNVPGPVHEIIVIRRP